MLWLFSILTVFLKLLLFQTLFDGLHFLVRLGFAQIKHSVRLLFFPEAISFSVILLLISQFLFCAHSSFFISLPKAVCFPV